MATASAPPFQPPAIPWRQPQQLSPLLDIGPGLDPEACRLALSRLCADTEVMAVVGGAADAERLSGSRWHVFGDVAREGKVLYVAG